MKDLLAYLVENITGKKDIVIDETEENGQITLKVTADSEDLGLLIGRQGQTIKAIQTLVRVRGRLDNKSVFVNIEEKSQTS